MYKDKIVNGIRSLRQEMSNKMGLPFQNILPKEIYAHILAYNLVRSLMWDAAISYNQLPLRLSLKGALQHLSVFAPLISVLPTPVAQTLYLHLLRAMAETLPNRPYRVEPRRKKNAPNPMAGFSNPVMNLRINLKRS
jgi:hypothetical protein